jgi:hypothetical protein
MLDTFSWFRLYFKSHANESPRRLPRRIEMIPTNKQRIPVELTTERIRKTLVREILKGREFNAALRFTMRVHSLGQAAVQSLIEWHDTELKAKLFDALLASGGFTRRGAR